MGVVTYTSIHSVYATPIRSLHWWLTLSRRDYLSAAMCMHLAAIGVPLNSPVYGSIEPKLLSI